MTILRVEYHYTAVCPVRNRRNPRQALVRSEMPVAFADVDAAACPLVATVEGTRHARKLDGGRPALETARVHAYAGGFVTPWDGETTADGLPILAPQEGGEPYEEPGLFAKWGMNPVERESLRWRGEVRTDEDGVRAEVLAKAAGMCLLDGRLMVPCPEPVLAVRHYRHWGEDRVEVVPSLVRPHSLESEQLFSLSHEDRALAHAQALSDRLGVPVVRYGSFELSPGASMPYDGLADYARGILEALRWDLVSDTWLKHPAAAAEPAFAEAMARLRGALDPAIEGSLPAIKDAFEALEAATAAYPRDATTGVDRLDEMMRGRFDGALMAYWAFDADREVAADADARDIPLAWR